MIKGISLQWVSTLIVGSLAIAGFSPIPSGSLTAIAHETKPSATGHPHGAEGHSTSGHTHKKVEVPAGQPMPTVNLVVRPDAMSGWNLEVKVTNFAFAPERVNTKSTSVNEGHAHLYVNGKKISRLYGNWYHLATLPPGINQITVTLNTNDHGDLTHRGKPIQATATVQVPK